MMVTRIQYDSILAHRQTYFTSESGKLVLCELLASLGLFRDPDELYLLSRDRPQLLNMVVEGLKLLKNLGVWTPENLKRLVDAMAQLPMPEIGEPNQENG